MSYITSDIEIVIGSFKYLSEDIELTLCIGGIAYADRPGLPVSFKVVKYLLVGWILKIDIIEYLSFWPTDAACVQ